ncbi:MAG: outer membrane protein assembly factor BamD [Desulfuromonas sp.]|uniref:outer membrane protein assembly factor BamD n=1 Tax=Desulfuromonas sp. TaxID=892 RepID=UPI000CB5A383|nr:outer membrane protein assembly factor BamD [Desulfuromonas sp.]PLX86482.1 MAG: outer membrane protein assembly factor BamD [Desulfuromonas sp.]
MTLRLLILALLLPALAACTPAASPRPIGQEAQQNFQEGERLFEKGHYQEAIAAWEKVRESYFSAQLNTLAELKIAEAYFRDSKFLEAAIAYENFLKEHPGHDRTSQVLYQMGMAYFKQILSPDRDQTATRNALTTFQSFARLYPDDPRIEEVAPLIQDCKGRLASHELYVGRFYLRTGEVHAAIGRLNALLTDYPSFEERAETYYTLWRAYVEMGDPNRAATPLRTLLKEFPDSKWAKKAR